MRAIPFITIACALSAVFSPIAKAGDDVLLARTVWADYESYLRHLGPNETGFYAITPDGLGGAASGCATTKCRPGPATREAALDRCRQVSPPSLDCIIFAEGRKIEVDYEIRPDE
jgi:hypothetical protein